MCGLRCRLLSCQEAFQAKARGPGGPAWVAQQGLGEAPDPRSAGNSSTSFRGFLCGRCTIGGADPTFSPGHLATSPGSGQGGVGCCEAPGKDLAFFTEGFPHRLPLADRGWELLGLRSSPTRMAHTRRSSTPAQVPAGAHLLQTPIGLNHRDARSSPVQIHCRGQNRRLRCLSSGSTNTLVGGHASHRLLVDSD